MKNFTRIFAFCLLVGMLLVSGVFPEARFKDVIFQDITGWVKDEAGNGLPSMRVEVWNACSPAYQQELEEAGWEDHYVIPKSDGTYTATVPHECSVLVLPKDPNGVPGTYHFVPGYRILMSHIGPYEDLNFVRVDDQ